MYHYFLENKYCSKSKSLIRSWKKQLRQQRVNVKTIKSVESDGLLNI